MSEQKIDEERMFYHWISLLDDAELKGVKWKLTAKGIRWAGTRIEELEAELAEANKKASQRGARMRIMREWMELYRCDADYLTIWDRLIGERPEAKDWFDEDGVPR